MRKGKHYLVCVFISALLVGLGAAAAMAAAANVTITGTQVGTSASSIGGCEGCSGWNINDIVELGANNVRFWAGMSRVEPVDDDGVYGSPTIAEIKANPNVIPWSTWDYWFKYYDGYFWSGYDHAQVVFYQQLLDCKNNGIMPIVTLRNVDNLDQPAWAQQLNPPNTPEDWNEWWEFVFAWVYYANVLNNLEIHDWQVHNEPENLDQGWLGTLADYIVFTQYTYDAIKYVYDTYLPGKSFRLYAPVAQHPRGEYVIETIKQNDAIVDVISATFYRPWNTTKDTLPIVHERIDLYDTDGVHEPINLAEWGHYQSRGYESVNGAIKWGEDLIWQSNLFQYPNGKGDISCIFSLYNWDGMQGLMEGVPPAIPTKTETYYAFRLIIRGLQGGRPMYGQVTDYGNQVVNTKAADGTLYVLLQGGTAANITLDVSAHVSSGTATFYEYSANHRDEIIGTANFSNGILNFTIPMSSFTLVEIPTTPPAPDTTPPSPNPMTWATVPYATGSTSIAMVATTATDPSGVEYYFDETSLNPGGTDSGWQAGTNYTDTGLSPSTQYTYRVQARDKSTNQNATGWSTSQSATTQAAPIFSDGFESGNFTTGGWTTSGSTATVTTAAKYTGTYGAKLGKLSWIEKAVSTSGKTSIHLKYARKTVALDPGEAFTAQWYNGSTWQVLESTLDTNWAVKDWTLPTGANNNPNFRIKFTSSGGHVSQEYSYLDDVEVSGQ